jgi:hypothetical protein
VIAGPPSSGRDPSQFTVWAGIVPGTETIPAQIGDAHNGNERIEVGA